jgi:hypothetical protein
VILGALWLAAGGLHPMDAPIPDPPPTPRSATLEGPQRPHEIGTTHTVFVNFDGIDLGECNPSDSHRNCHWYNFDREFPPFSGSDQIKVAIMQAMRDDAEEFGLRITSQRPPSSEGYTMVVYGGEEVDYGALGSAPSGDCYNMKPNEIAFAHLDGELVEWINGGSTTALHESAHTWGLDHVDVDGTIMFPAGNNSPAYFNDGCGEFVPSPDRPDPSCPEINAMFCASSNQQHDFSLLRWMFGEPYVDTTPPTVELVEPMDGQYFQVPGKFSVIVDVFDDLHPQAYSQWAWIEGMGARPAEPSTVVSPGFNVDGLPIGSYTFNLVIADEAGHEASLSFEVEVGEDPPPDPVVEDPDEGCACTATREGVSGGSVLGWLVLLLAIRRREQ